MNRYLLAAHRRPDLLEHFPNPMGADIDGLCAWAWTEGVAAGLDPELLPPPPEPLPRRLRLELCLRPVRQRARGLAEAAAQEPRRRIETGRSHLANAAERRLRRPLPNARERLEARIVAAARQARRDYRAAPWPGRVVLVTSTELEDRPAYLAWPERALGGVERQALPLGHIEMMREPGAAQLAECLERCIVASLGR